MSKYKSEWQKKLETEAATEARSILGALDSSDGRESALGGALVAFAEKAVMSDRRRRREQELIRATLTYNGRELFLTNTAVAQLVRAGEFVVFFQELKDDEYRQGARALTLSLLCSDLFAWGCADSEEIESEEEFRALYDAVRADPSWGSTRWVCRKRNEQPQRPVKEDMIESGAWDESMEALPENAYDKHRREKYGEAA